MSSYTPADAYAVAEQLHETLDNSLAARAALEEECYALRREVRRARRALGLVSLVAAWLVVLGIWGWVR